MNALWLWFGLTLIEGCLYVYARKQRGINYTTVVTIRISTLILFSVLILFDVITWGFRYYSAVFVLSIMSLVTTFRMVNKETQYIYLLSKKKIVINSVLFVIILVPALVFPEYQPLKSTGNFPVSTMSFIIEDNHTIDAYSKDNQSRQVGVHVWYPDTQIDDKYPLIIYSHGGISLSSSNESLFLELASHGYVVFSIDHLYHSIVTKNNADENIWINNEYMKELNRENAGKNPKNSLQLYQGWMTRRTEDINFLIDYIKHAANSSESLPIINLVDIDNIGVIGHSLGGSAALCVGRNRDDVKAVIALESPYMCDVVGVEDDAFVFDDTPFPVPVLNMYSDSIWHKLDELPQYYQNNQMLSSTDSIVNNVYIEGSGHFSLTDLSLTSPLITRLLNGFRTKTQAREILTIINETSVEFLDNNLK